MNRKIHYFVSIAAFSLQPTIAFGQTKATVKEAALQAVQEGTQGGTSSSSTFSTLAPAFQIETSGDDTNATVSMSFSISSPEEPKTLPNEATTLTFGTTTANIAASAPLGKNGKPSLFDFDRLGDGTTLKLGASHFWGTVNYLPHSDAGSNFSRTNRLTKVCIAAASENMISGAEDRTKKSAELDALFAVMAAYQDERPNLGAQLAIDKAVRSRVSSISATATAIAKKCFEGFEGGELTTNTLADKYGTDDDKKKTGDWDASGLWFLGGSGKVARTNYTFVDQLAFKADEASKTAYKFEVFGGHIAKGGMSSWQVSAAYARSYTEQDAIDICQPNGVGAQFQCLAGANGQPVRASKYILAGEYRHWFKIDGIDGAAIAFAPKVSYEIKSKGALIDLPIYFAPDKEKGLNGGVRFGYDTKLDDFGFGLFVGIPFSVFY